MRTRLAIMDSRWRWGRLPALCASILLAGGVSASGALSAKVAIEKNSVYLGESFIYQIQVSGSDEPEQPDVSVEGAAVQFAGGQQNNSQSISIVNGQMTRNVSRGYVFNFRITPQRKGVITIPSVTVRSGRETTRTQAVQIQVREPSESPHHKFGIELSKDSAYVGEPVLLRLKWRLGQRARSPQFLLPSLTNRMVRVLQPKQESGRQYVDGGVVLNGQPGVHAVMGREIVDGEQFVTVTVEQVLIPVEAGRLELGPATLAFEEHAGRQRRQSPFGTDVFDDFFSGSPFGARDVYRPARIPAEPAALEIMPLPEEGRPPGFEGHVGEYRIETSASPTAVSVGDPIELTARLSGPPYLEHVDLPRLDRQPALVRDFKIPEDREAGRIEGQAKVFKRTLRAKTDSVEEIPPVTLVYFDTGRGSYEVARSEPVPLTVRPSRVLTADDAEGVRIEPGPKGREVENRGGGIAHNYAREQLLVDQRAGPGVWLRSPFWLATLTLPPVAYAGLLAFVLAMRRRNANPEALRARRAWTVFERELAGAKDAEGADPVMKALQGYLGARLNRSTGALTFADVRDELSGRGGDEELLKELKRVFDACEAGRYAGGAAGDSASLRERCLETVRRIEEVLRK